VKRRVIASIAGAMLLAASTAQGAERDQALKMPSLSPDYVKLRDQIAPNASEQSYRKIGWRNSVLHGLVDAQKNDKPVMMVLMNGHPLGCT
jgi:hypothetical protein